MTNGNSELFDCTAGKIISELNDKLRETEDKARYWQDKYDKALHDYLELEKATEETNSYLTTLKERFAEVIAENHILKQSVFFGNDKRAHDIALAALKMEWKKGEIHHQNDSESMGYYLAAYKYALEQLEADQNKD